MICFRTWSGVWPLEFLELLYISVFFIKYLIICGLAVHMHGNITRLDAVEIGIVHVRIFVCVLYRNATLFILSRLYNVVLLVDSIGRIRH